MLEAVEIGRCPRRTRTIATPKPRRRRRKPVSDVEDARRQEKERTAAEEAEKAPPPDPRDAERRELWKELGAYGDSLRERVDFPENYDEVVQLMSRNDLTQKEETWSEAALAGGDFSKYANLFADDENDKKLRAGLATIERLDRELKVRRVEWLLSWSST